MAKSGAGDAHTNPYRAAIVGLRGSFVMVGVFSALVNILMLTGPVFMLQVYDRVLASGSVATLQGLFLIVVLMFGFLALYDFLRIRIMSRASYRLDQAAGPQVFDHWLRSGLGDLPGTDRPLTDLAVVRGFLPGPAMLALFDTPWIPVYLMIVFVVHPLLGWLTLAGLVVVTLLALVNQITTQKSYVQAMQADGAEAFFADQARRNADSIVPLGMAGRVQQRWADIHHDGLALGQAGGDRAEAFTAGSRSFRMLLQSALLALGGYLALDQQISAGMIVAASIIAGRALAPVDQIIGQWRAIVRARDAHQRLKRMMDHAVKPRQVMELPDPVGRLSVSGVTKFAPGQVRGGDRPPILDGLSFVLEQGDAVGVIGPSASGKSTLARILVGGWKADAGIVRLDGAPLDQWGDAALGRHIGYLPQQLEMLAGTIRDNISRFDPLADDLAVIEAARVAGVHDMILRLPEGYATQFGFSAPPLSGGQLQRIGLARAIYGNPRYVVLDEPNSNLDSTGDEALARAILTLREKGSTLVVMAHRPSAIAAVNKVMVLQAGRIVDFGPKEEVLRKSLRQSASKLHQASA